MLLVGLTGGIGSGKSTVAAHLRNLGATVIDSDQLAREVVAAGTPGLQQVIDRFGPTVISDGELNRGALANLVFTDAGARADLEAITHPLIRARFNELLSGLPEDAIVVNEVPLLVEREMAPQFDLVVCVEASEEVKRGRLLDRGLSVAEIERRVSTQATDEQRRKVCDVVITNDGSLPDLVKQVEQLWRERLRPGS